MVIPKKHKEILEKLKLYKEQMSSAQQWNDFKKENADLGLPHSNTLINYFGSWNNVKELVDDLPVQKQWEMDELKEVLKNHLEGLKGTPLEWEEYKLENPTETLPSSTTIINKFNSWNNMKQMFHLPQKNNNRPEKYSDEELIKIVDEHIPYSLSQRNWNKYKKGKALPSYTTLMNRVGDYIKEKNRLNVRSKK